MFVPNATLARIIRSVVANPSPRQVAKIRTLPATGLIGTAAYAYYARKSANRAEGRRLSALADDTTSGLVRLRFTDAETIVRTMIAAAATDAEAEDSDHRRILRYLREAGATPAEYGYAEAEARHPASAEELAKDIADQETAMELYAAALLATEGTTPPARRFLAQLAHALDLPFDFLSELHASWGETVPTLATPAEPTPVQR
jgi:uncharacterized membrane protein YebE (DUF533 family)